MQEGVKRIARRIVRILRTQDAEGFKICRFSGECLGIYRRGRDALEEEAPQRQVPEILPIPKHRVKLEAIGKVDVCERGRCEVVQGPESHFECRR